MATAIDNSSLLLYRVGPVLCCAPSLPIDSIIHPPALTRPPGTDTAKPGIFKHAGHIVSSLDLRYKFGVDETQWVNPGRMVVTSIDLGHIGFWVDEILDVIEFPSSGWGPLPAHLPKGVFSRTLILDKKIYLYAEFDQLYRIPTSGYLRVYIEQLLADQEREDQKRINQQREKQQTNEIKKAAGAKSIKSSVTKIDSSISSGQQASQQETKNYSNFNKGSTASAHANVSVANRSTTRQDSTLRSTTTNKKSSNIHTLDTDNPTTSQQLTGDSGEKNHIGNEQVKKPLQHDKADSTVSGLSTPDTIGSDKITNSTSPTLPKINSAQLSASKAETDQNTAKKAYEPAASHDQNASATIKQTVKNESTKNDLIVKNAKTPDFIAKQTPVSQTLPSADKSDLASTAPNQKQEAITPTPSIQHSNRQATTDSVKDKNTVVDEDTQSSGVIPALFILVMLVGGFAGLTWYLTQDPDSAAIAMKKDHTPDKPGIDSLPKTELAESNLVPDFVQQDENPVPVFKRTELIETVPVPVTEVSVPAEPKMQTDETATSLIEVAKHDAEQSELGETDPVLVTEVSVPAEPEIQTDETATSLTEVVKRDSEQPELGETDPVPDTEVSVPAEPKIQTDETATPKADVLTADNEAATASDIPAFKADIQKDDDGITIVLEAPEQVNVFKQDNKIKQTDQRQAEDSTRTETQENISIELVAQDETNLVEDIVEEKPAPRVTSTEIIHIVVKGDTLWHIAIKYVNDPYKYPELAKLSNIKNPDLIYPGNRVRIIKRSRQSR